MVFWYHYSDILFIHESVYVMSLVNISEAASLGLHTMAVLAKNNRRRFANQDIANLLGASGNHLAKVMQRLVKAGLVNSIRGPLGGFRLDKPSSAITLMDIYEAVEGPMKDFACLSDNPICETPGCILGQTVQNLHEQLKDCLIKTTLCELADSFSLSPAHAKLL